MKDFIFWIITFLLYKKSYVTQHFMFECVFEPVSGYRNKWYI